MPTPTTPLWRHLLVPVDFSDCSLEALRLGVQMLVTGSTEKLTLLVAVERSYSGLRIQTDDLHAAMRGEAERHLKEWKEREAGDLEKVEARVVEGPPGHAICEAAREGGVDLIVIGSHGRTGLPRMLLGSTAEKVVRHAPCAVLVKR